MKRPLNKLSPCDLMVVLQRPRAIVTLLCLYHAENKGLDMLLQEIGGSKRTGMARINDFSKIGIVTRLTDKHSRKTLYVLTDEGCQIAEKMEDIISFWTSRRASPEVKFFE